MATAATEATIERIKTQIKATANGEAELTMGHLAGSVFAALSLHLHALPVASHAHDLSPLQAVSSCNALQSTVVVEPPFVQAPVY